MRPVTVNGAPAYQIPVTMTTYKAAIKTGLANNGVGPVSGTSTFNTAAVLTVLANLTAQNGAAAKWGNLNAANKALVTGLINYFTENDNVKYGNARGSLLDNYGQYCNYCGTPVQDTALAIEHCLPKAVFPSQMLYYTNFFLCCPSCNSFKSSQPGWADSWNWANQYIQTPPANLNQVLQGGMQRQKWPDSVNAFTGFPPFLRDVTNNQTVPDQYARQTTNVQVGIVQNTVRANIPNYANNITVACLIGLFYANATENQQEVNFRNIVQINSFTAGVYSDRRVTNRTVVWLTILNSMNNLNMFQAGSGPWRLMLSQIFVTAKSAGFMEIWAYLLYWLSPPNVGQNSVYLLFRTAVTNANAPSTYFPGTNANEMPTN